MNVSRLFVRFLLFIPFACVDRIQFEIDSPPELPISVSGRITNQPGPYKVYLNSSFDIDSEVNLKTPVSAKHVNLLDELGNDEELVEVEAGVYQTNSTQGRLGGVYNIRIEFLDGRIYESIPDTILIPGEIDSLYHDFNSDLDNTGTTNYGFNVLVNSHRNKRNDVYYLWEMTGTFKAITHPELFFPTHPNGCYPIPEQQNKCNFIPLCTGLRNTASPNFIPNIDFDFERVGPCECCTCWYQIFNNSPILSDDLYTSSATYNTLHIDKIPLDAWIFMFKIHVQVSQFTLTKNSFDIFKSIRDQKQATGSLFQPITGKIPSSFVQESGTPTPIHGVFYAAGVSSKSNYITPYDVPSQILVPQIDFAPRGREPGFGWVSCLELFPNATNIKPDFWED